MSNAVARLRTDAAGRVELTDRTVERSTGIFAKPAFVRAPERGGGILFED